MSEVSPAERRKQDKLRKWANTQRMLQNLTASGVQFRRGAQEGPASGIAYIEHANGTITLRLSSAIWTQGEEKGRGWKSLQDYLN